MGQRKGQTGNPKGRPKGTPNKVTGEVKCWIRELIDNNRQQLETDLTQLEPAERWRVVERLMSYVVPKMQSVEAKIDLNNLTDEQLNQIVDNVVQTISENDTTD